MRKDEDFNSICTECDHLHLIEAKQKKESLIYRCHSNLYEGIIPLYDQGRYFGALVFGQVRPLDANKPPGNLTADEAALFNKLPSFSREYLKDLADLLGRLSEYIVIKELVHYRNQQWAVELRKYIDINIDKRIKLADLAQWIDKSESFISHFFQNEFGLSPKQFILNEKIKMAKSRLAEGSSVRETALSLGFYDEFHFSRIFKRKTGETPSHYRNNLIL